ncbi:MAG: DUF2914 domain-containing protein [Acidobacteria bacterium]|nr:DUF2914 domain-containing protein [Acidobacteriota bacterium]
MKKILSTALRGLAPIVIAGFPVLVAAQEGSPGAAQEPSADRPVPEAAAEVQVTRSALCLRVEGREPVEVDTVFPPEVGKIFAFTKVEGVDQPTQITHIWYHGDREMGRVPLSVSADGWRTWSTKTILPAWTGAWRVEVLDAGGNRIKTLEFRVGGPEPGSTTG